MKLLISFGLLISVSASPLPGIPNDLPLIQQLSVQSEIDQRNAFILESINGALGGETGNFKEQELKDDTLNILNAIKEMLNNEVNKGDDGNHVKVQNIADNNGLAHINKELQKKQIKALPAVTPDDNKAEKNSLSSPVNILRSENNLYKEDDLNKDINLEQADDQYELKIAGYKPHILNFEKDINESSVSHSDNDSESMEEDENNNHGKRLFDPRYFRLPQTFQIRAPVEL